MTIYLAGTIQIERIKYPGNQAPHKSPKPDNKGANNLVALIKYNPGHFSKNIERWLNHLKDKRKVEFNGAPKTGGYFVIVNNGNRVNE